MLRHLLTLLAAAGLMSSCITTAREKEIRRDIFDIQTRLMRFEQVYEKQTGDVARQKLAAAATELDRVRADVNRLNGDMDALRVGVASGKMPGTPDSPDTVAARLKALEEKMDLIQQAQEEILQLLEKGGGKNAKSARNNEPEKRGNDRAESGSSDRGIRSFDDLKSAFNRNRFQEVSQDAQNIVRSLKGRDKDEALYMYAESLYRTGNTLDAALQFSNYLETKPRRERVAHSKLRLGDCFRANGDPGTARIYYKEIVRDFPSSSEARRSRERLAEMSRDGADRDGKTEQK